MPSALPTAAVDVALRDLVPGPAEAPFAFLFGLLHPNAQLRYVGGLNFLGHALAERRVHGFFHMAEEQQDYILCDVLFEAVDENIITVQQARDMVAVVQKRFLGRRRYLASFTLVRALASQQPECQAAPFPATVLYALVVILTVIGCDRVATALLTSFTGLLGISEALNLMWEDVVFPD